MQSTPWSIIYTMVDAIYRSETIVLYSGLPDCKGRKMLEQDRKYARFLTQLFNVLYMYILLPVTCAFKLNKLRHFFKYIRNVQSKTIASFACYIVFGSVSHRCMLEFLSAPCGRFEFQCLSYFSSSL